VPDLPDHETGRTGGAEKGRSGPAPHDRTAHEPSYDRTAHEPAPPETDAERRRRRARFLRDLAEARALRDRVQPRRAKSARLRHAMRMRTFRW
jgi:hypothetical protein